MDTSPEHPKTGGVLLDVLVIPGSGCAPWKLISSLTTLASAWKYALDREHWKHLVETATLQLGPCA